VRRRTYAGDRRAHHRLDEAIANAPPPGGDRRIACRPDAAPGDAFRRKRASPEAGMTSDRNVATNRFLASVPARHRTRLDARLEPVTLRFGEVLHDPGKPI
jgi:hypothetical protein